MTKPTRKVLAVLALLPAVGLAGAMIATMSEPAREAILGLLLVFAIVAGTTCVAGLAIWGLRELFGRSR